MLRAALASALLTAAAACSAPPAADGGRAGDGWTDLFDGETLAGWRGFNGAPAPTSWRVTDGALHFAPTGTRGDLFAAGTYGDFELEAEWRVAPCGNSGIFYRTAEADGLDAPWRTALEYQVLDDACHPDGVYPSHRASALYDLYVPAVAAARPAGEWNRARIVVQDGRVEHWLNGERVVQAQIGSADWDARVAASKFRDAAAFPGFGTYAAGAVGLQDHGDEVWYRSVRVRPLP